MLGIEVEEEEISTGKIVIGTLVEFLKYRVVETEEGYKQRARLYILIMLAGHLFPDSSSHEVPLNYVANFEDFSVEARRSWGTAVLAYLHRNLCKAAENSRKKVYKELCGCYRFGWNTTFGNKNTPAHCITTTRSAFTTLDDDQFIGEPYTTYILRTLPAECTHDRNLWVYIDWMIFYSTVEPHVPQRLCRQLGFVQQIPTTFFVLPPNKYRELHDMTLKGKADIDWVEKHREYVDCWNNGESC
ncbi:serine/threonine-protein phosphatase 7 long form homolog [Rutidosis leptorrhynchoides]|uniref:serine/threonine-protein phosphatase 7 long form homolog n=1 Tax=Rutidosis leptorrhynchoides TaxID=125765 RepID=UPI003A993488